MQLRHYQAAAVEHVLRKWAENPSTRCLLAMPTGAGKTETAAAILATGTRPVALVHTRVLLEQTERRLRHIPGIRVMTIQSLLEQHSGSSLRMRGLDDSDIVWVDEAHHLAAEEWGAVGKSFSSKKILGTSATPTTVLGEQFDDLFSPIGYRQLISEGFLVPCDVLQAAPTGSAKADAIAAYLEHGARRDSDGVRIGWRPGIYTASTVAKCEDAAERLERFGVRCAVVSADTPKAARGALFGAYATGQLDMLLSPMVLAEGFDSPRAEVLVADRGFGELVTFLQYVGRVLRPFPGKERALYIDTSQAVRRHGMPTDNRCYSLIGGTEAARENEEGQEEDADTTARRERELVEARYTLIRDTIADRLRAIQELAEERGYARGYIYHQFMRQTGLQLPNVIVSRYKSVCGICRHRVKVDERIVWSSKRAVHVDCWIQSLDEPSVLKAGENLKV